MATKKTSTRSKAKTSAAASEKERQKRELHSRQQFWAIVVFAVAIFIMATTLIEGQNVWNWIHNFFLGMFGWSAYLIAPLRSGHLRRTGNQWTALFLPVTASGN